MPARITPAQRRFALALAQPGCTSTTDAYLIAYDSKRNNRASPSTIRTKTARLLARSDIRGLIRRHKQDIALAAGLTPQHIAAQVLQIAQDAAQAKDRRTALAAYTQLAKWMGMEDSADDGRQLAQIAAAAAGAAAGSKAALTIDDAISRAMQASNSTIDAAQPSQGAGMRLIPSLRAADDGKAGA